MTVSTLEVEPVKATKKCGGVLAPCDLKRSHLHVAVYSSVKHVATRLQPRDPTLKGRGYISGLNVAMGF
jgi:hypothetical protein